MFGNRSRRKCAPHVGRGARGLRPVTMLLLVLLLALPIAMALAAGPIPPYETNLSSISETQIVGKDASITGTVRDSGGNAVSGV